MRYIKEMVDADLEDFAYLLSTSIVIRGKNKREIIPSGNDSKMFLIAYGALLTARWNHSNPNAKQAIMDYAEFMFNKAYEDYDAEGYRSIYLPLDLILNTDEKEIKIDEDKVRRYLNEN